jgi:hypothetical protein
VDHDDVLASLQVQPPCDAPIDLAMGSCSSVALIGSLPGLAAPLWAVFVGSFLIHRAHRVIDRLSSGVSEVQNLDSRPAYGERMTQESIDLGSVVSRYIEETRTQLEHLFDAAENTGGVLLSDEADALFGKRSSLRSKDGLCRIGVVSAIIATTALAFFLLRRRHDSATAGPAVAGEDFSQLDTD